MEACNVLVIHDNVTITFQWSWWDSNPRPNKETIRFLHAYSGLWFSCGGRTRTINRHLIPLNFIKAVGHTLTISDLSAPLDQEDSEQHPLSDVSSHHLVTGLSQSTILQLRQRERNFFRQL